MPALQIDVGRAGVVDLNPIRGVAVLVREAAVVLGEKLANEDVARHQYACFEPLAEPIPAPYLIPASRVPPPRSPPGRHSRPLSWMSESMKGTTQRRATGPRLYRPLPLG